VSSFDLRTLEAQAHAAEERARRRRLKTTTGRVGGSESALSSAAPLFATGRFQCAKLPSPTPRASQ
jgi:hypothetical protein